MKNCMVCLLIMVLCFCSYAFQVKQSSCSQPLIVEYISNYQIPTNDLQTLIQKNFSSFNVPDIQNINATFTSINADLKYIDGSKKVQNLSPMKLNITNDSFSMTLTWDITVFEAIYTKNRHYHAKVEIASIATSYFKQFLTNQSKFNISNFQILFKEEMIEQIVYNETRKGKDQEKIKSLVKTQFFNKISAQLNTFPLILQDAVAKQRVAITFPDRLYLYNFQQTKIEINTTTLTFSKEDDNTTFVNGYNGLITGQVDYKCPVSTPKNQEGYSLYISDSFIDNFVSTSLKTHQGYQKMLFDSTLKTGIFQWKLLDLEFVLQDFGNYQDKILNNIYFECSVKPDFSLNYSSNQLKASTSWDCIGKLQIDGEGVPIIDSTLNFIDSIQLYVQAGSLQVTQNNKKLLSSEYREISGLKVKDSKQADTFIRYLLRYWPSRVIGDQFKVQPGNSEVKVEDNKARGAGIWIG